MYRATRIKEGSVFAFLPPPTYEFLPNHYPHDTVEVCITAEVIRDIGFWDQCGIWVDVMWIGTLPEQLILE